MKPISINSTITVLYYYFAFVDGDLSVYGELENVSSAGGLVPNIRFEFFDENGNSYGADEAEPVSYWLEAGQRMPFDALSLLGGAIAPGDWASVKLSAGRQASDYYLRDTSTLTIEDAPAEGPHRVVAGRIRNSGNESVTGLTVYQAIYDEENIYVGACTSFTPSSDAVIPPGGAIRFESGGGSCGNTARAITERGSEGPFMQRLIIVRSQRAA